MDTFEKDVYGEVPCNDFIAQFKGLLTDVPGAARRPVVQASRYFSNPSDMLHEIALEIQDRQIKDFGSFLKGNDYKHTDRISKANFYQVLKKLFDELLGEGDIMDLIHYFDPKDSRQIDIQRVAREINGRITAEEYMVKLESQVDDLIEDNIFEEIPKEERKGRVTREEPSGKPKFYLESMRWDIACSALIKVQGELGQWLGQFDHTEDGSLS
jgi:hypothetical protein